MFLLALIVLPTTVLGLRIIGFRRWRRLTTALTWSSSKHNRPLQLEEARQIARLVKSAGRYGICNGNCLQQSVVLWWLLQLKNTEAAIRFGARKQNDQLDAHAWVEYRGIVLNDDSELHGRFGLFKPVFPPRSERA